MKASIMRTGMGADAASDRTRLAAVSAFAVVGGGIAAKQHEVVKGQYAFTVTEQEEIAALREQSSVARRWPNGIVPAATIATEVIDADLGITIEAYPELAGNISVTRLEAILTEVRTALAAH